MKRPNKKKLYKLYQVEKLSTTDIAKIYGISSGTIWYLLKKFNIPIRTIKEAPNKGQFKKGHIPWIVGKHHSQKTIEKMRESSSGEKHPFYGKRDEKSHAWRGGISKNYGRRVWERENKMKIPKGFVIHHIDGNTKNNKIENLQLVSGSKHAKIHNKHYNLPHIKKKSIKLGFEVMEE